MGLLQKLRNWRHRRRLARCAIERALWNAAIAELDVIQTLTAAEHDHLYELVSLCLCSKRVEAAGGLELDDVMVVQIAAQACLPVLELGLEYLEGWYAVVVYPAAFVADHEELDDSGVLHTEERELIGEAWDRGPLILAWEDARPGARPHGEGSNVVIHEIAHKLDLLNGAANGMPPLHGDMDRAAWTEAFSSAFDDLNRRLDRDHEVDIDPYAATEPAEFFAVVSEYFFVDPRTLARVYPRVYAQLRAFYRQDPAHRNQW